VREVKIPRVRWHIGTLGEIANVAEITLVHNAPVFLFGYALHLPRLAFVNQVEKRGEGAAKADTTPTPMTDIKDALHLGQTGLLVVELWVLPVEWVSCRGLE
jgi:hypothetical protein